MYLTVPWQMLKIIHDSKARQIKFLLEWSGQKLTHVTCKVISKNDL